MSANSLLSLLKAIGNIMAADPIIYCLENLTDYDQFERLCHDLMAASGYRTIEPLGWEQG